MSAPQERVVSLKTSTVLRTIGVFLLLGVAWFLRDIIALVFVALFLAALMHPAVRWGAQRRIPKGVMVFLMYIILFTVLVFIFALLIPMVLHQMGNLSQKIGSSIVMLSTHVQQFRDFSQQFGLADDVSFGIASLQNQITRTASGLFSTLTGVFGGLIGLVVVLVMAFYMVVQEEEAAQAFRNLVPPRHQEFVMHILVSAQEKIRAWLRGQLFLSLTIGVLYYVALLVLGVEGAFVLALFAAFTEFIPYLGPMLGGLPVMIVAFSDSPVKALLAFVAVVVIQQFENHVLVPKVMQRTLGLNPLISIIAVLIGAKVYGIVGALLAIPLATILSVVLTEIYRYRQSRLDPITTV